MTKQTLIKLKWIILPAACFFFSFFLITAANAGKKDGTQELQMQRRTIEKKSADLVITNYGEQFAISTATLIIDQDGGQTSIKRMPVPCDVDFSYEIQTGGRRMIYRIEIINVHDDASDKMWRKPQ